MLQNAGSGLVFRVTRSVQAGEELLSDYRFEGVPVEECDDEDESTGEDEAGQGESLGIQGESVVHGGGAPTILVMDSQPGSGEEGQGEAVVDGGDEASISQGF